MNDWRQWDGFEGHLWKEEVNTRDFIQKNYQLIHVPKWVPGTTSSL